MLLWIFILCRCSGSRSSIHRCSCSCCSNTRGIIGRSRSDLATTADADADAILLFDDGILLLLAPPLAVVEVEPMLNLPPPAAAAAPPPPPTTPEDEEVEAIMRGGGGDRPDVPGCGLGLGGLVYEADDGAMVVPSYYAKIG